MHIISSSCQIFSWFGNVLASILLLFCIIKSHLVFLIFHGVIAIYSPLLI